MPYSSPNPSSQNLPWARALVVVALLTAACAEDLGASRAALETDPRTFEVSSDAEKQAQTLAILEAFVPHAESFWRASDLAEPNTGRYDAVGSGVTQPRGAGNIAFAYATLLRAYPARATIGGVPRATLIDHTIQSIRHEALTNVLSGAPYRRWGGGTWQASLELYGWAFAAHYLWDVLDADTRALVERVIVGEADILVTKPIESREEGDTGAEDNAWNTPTPALAAVMFPSHANRAAWEDAAIRLAYNSSSRAADEADTTPADGRTISDWMASVNLHPDLTLENHGFFNPIYQQVVHVSIGDAAIVYALAGHPIPGAFSYRADTVWDEILAPLATDEGDFAMPAGQDWTSKDFQHLDYLTILATRFGREDASVYESRALALVAQRQATHPSGSILGQPQLGYETMLLQRLAAAYWHHRLFGPSPSPSAAEYDAARAPSHGVRHFEHSDFIAGRLERAFVSMSWDPARPMALVVPHGDETPDDRVFSYYAPNNLIGSASGAVPAYGCNCEEDRFSTAGTIGNRRFSMTAFSDGTSILLDQGTGSTFTYSLESIAGITGERPIWTSAGSSFGDFAGPWVNVADRLGMIVRGGAGMRAQTSGETILLTGSIDTGTGDRAALVLPLADRDETEALEPFATQLAAPTGWSALGARAPDASVRLAVARWAGHPIGALTITDPRGAPVPVRPATLAAHTTNLVVGLDSPASEGQTMRWLVRADREVYAEQASEHAAILRNVSPRSNRVRATYAAPSGRSQVRDRVLGGGEEVVARVVDGSATLAGPELEPLLEALEALDEADVRGHRHSRHRSSSWLRSELRSIERSIEEAIDEARSVDPDAARAARFVDHARERLEDIARDRRLREETEDAIEDARAALERAEEVGFGITAVVVPLGRVQPGEPVTLQVTMRNRGFERAYSGAVSLVLPEGWTTGGEVEAFRALLPDRSVTVELEAVAPTDLVPGSRVELAAHATYRMGCRPWRWRHHPDPERRESTGTLRAFVDPLFTLAPRATSLPLGPGGFNEAIVELASWIDRPLEITVGAIAPPGATVGAPRVVTLPAAGTVEVSLALRGVALTTGTASLPLSAATTNGVRMDEAFELRFTDDLALNATGAPWPRISSSSNQPPFPAALAADGQSATFWVSSGTLAGEGPTPARPEWLMNDMGASVLIGSVEMIPRVNFGPTALTIELSDDAVTWRTVATVAAVPNGPRNMPITPSSARYVRMSMTGAWDRIVPSRNVQVASFIVRPPEPGDLAANPTGAAFPASFASSNQPAFPARLAFDANSATFWVSSGTLAGQGPTPARPEYLGVDFGSVLPIGAVRMIPRVNFGPTAYSVQVSNDGVAWTTVATQPSVPNGTITTNFAPVTARMVRLEITGGWDRIVPSRNVQVVTLSAFAPP